MMLIRKGTGEDPRLIEKDKVPYLEFEALKKQSWLTRLLYKTWRCEQWLLCVYEPGFWTRRRR